MADFKPFDSANKVLITGAAGFIGFHLAKRLLTMGATILGLDKQLSAHKTPIQRPYIQSSQIVQYLVLYVVV